jgi:beta-lactam-binding protein with PASTA domain
MPFNPTRWLLARTVMSNEGVPTDDANRLALLPGMIDMPLAQSMVLSVAVGRANVPAQPAPPMPADSVFVPAVEGKTLEAAEAELRRHRLRASRQTVAGAPANKVSLQKPEAGEPVPVGSTVVLYTGAQPPQAEAHVQVPDVVDKRPEEAEAELTESGLVPVRAVVENRQGDKVLQQNPDPGDFMPVNSEVVIYVPARGAEQKGSPEQISQSSS